MADLSRARVEAMVRAGCWERTVRAMGCIHRGSRRTWQDSVTEVPDRAGRAARVTVITGVRAR